MDIGYRRYVNEYIDFLDSINNVVDASLYNAMDINIDEFISIILNYVHENFPAILLSKEELIEKVKNIYKQKTTEFKKNVDFRKATIKFKLSGSLPDVKKEMEQGNEDIKICFKSVSLGTNISYRDTVINISSDIFGTIQRNCNNNLLFAKKTRETQEKINEITLEYYCKFMMIYGKELQEKGLTPLKEILEQIQNYKEISNRDIIKQYNEHIKIVA
ncbi:MAG: hypothetical protein J6B64_01980 [Bacilli bacterium]|nr:hypothetical protein [Bacilli bacterium]MBP3921325.1 hypothetical protein [Bacilli bacterium]